MDLLEAQQRFQRAMAHCDSIVQVHKQHGGGGKGFRSLEPSLNRAIVVLAVAAWQTAVQDLTTAALDHTCPPGGRGVGALLRGQVEQAVGGFSTPNAQKSRDLLKLVDFDPWPHWTWSQMGGQGVGSVVVTSSHAAQMTDEWLRLRHGIAHGHANLSTVEVLESVRLAANAWSTEHPKASDKDAINHLKSDASSFEPTLRLVDAQRCMTHFRRMAKKTAAGLHATGIGPGHW